ncbi:uncharacterized protein [Nicotiana sylvestris]|uniref:uncharacterized protein n=1 Tax=Nicotiana sylvestris TaxID=4096 RepID=UPI00388C5CE6
MTTSHALSLPTYFEEAIKEANALRMPDPSKVLEEDPFQSCFAGVEDTIDLNDASTIFEEAQHLLCRDIIKFRAELSQCEAEHRKVSGKEKALRLFCSRKEEELKDLRAELAKARKNESELDEQIIVILTEYGFLGLTSEANTLISQLRQKLEMIGQLRGEVDQVKADCHRWKESMDQLAADKEAGQAQAKKIEELEAELARARAEVVQAKAEAEKTKAAANKSIAIYLKDAVTIQAELREASVREKRSNDLSMCQARRETLEEIHARGFDLAEEIAEAKARETDARFHVSFDDKEVTSGSGDEKGEEDVPEGEEAPEDRADECAVLEDGTPGDMTSKIDQEDVPSSSSRSSKGKAIMPPRVRECVPGSFEMTSDFKTEKPSSKPGRYERVSQYVSSIAKKGSRGGPLIRKALLGEADTMKPAKEKKRCRKSPTRSPKSKKAKVEEPKADSATLILEIIGSP